MLLKRRHSCRGFTLLELLVVLLIMSLSVALVVPSIGKGLEGLRVHAAARKLAAVLRRARSLALAHNAIYQVVISPRERVYQVVRAEGWWAVTGDGSWQEGKGSSLLEGVEMIAAEPPVFAFFPGGGSSGGTILLAGEGGKSLRVQVDPVTGLVRILK